jgi:hypothetical protein
MRYHRLKRFKRNQCLTPENQDKTQTTTERKKFAFPIRQSRDDVGQNRSPKV